jgi:hypothetical protein
MKSLKERATTLMAKSQANIDKLPTTKDKWSVIIPDPSIVCVICNKPASRNLRADDYFEYWQMPMDGYKKYIGAYLCSKHTDDLNRRLGKIKGGKRYV